GAIVNDATWQEGNPFLNILGAVATQASISGAMSGAFGALRGFKKGAHGEIEVPTAHDLASVRTSKGDFESMFEHFQAKRPGATHADFRVELDETMLRLDKRAFAGDGMQRALRGELLEGVPAAQRKAFAGAKIEVVDGATWKQKFGAPEGAVVAWHEGKPLVIVPAGTELGALGKTSPHLFDPPSAPVHGGAGPSAEPHGSPRGASASPDPRAPRPPARPVIVEPFAGPDLESAIDISRKNPSAHVIATEATIRPPPEEVARLQAAGGAFHPDNLHPGLPHGSVDEIKMRFPLPHDDQMRSAFMRHLRELQDLHPGRSLVELSEEAARRLETATGYGPYALQRLKPGGSMEVVFWEPRIADELHDLTKLRFVDPQSGKVYKFEIVGSEQLPKSQIAPHSGFGVPIGPHDPVNVARLRKVEIEFVSPSGGRGPNLAAGEVVGTHSGRPFFPERAGGPIRDLDLQKIKITDKGIEAVERHLARFGGGDAEAAMVERLRRIAKGDIPATDHDRAFYAHELRESVRYKKAGWPVGQPSERGAAYDLWNDLHTATLEDYKLRERDHLGRSSLFHPDVDPDAPVRGPTGGRGPAGGPEPKAIHPWDPDQPLGFRPGERHLPPDVRAALEAELSRSKVLGKALEQSGGSLAMLDDGELIAQYNAYRSRLKVERPEIIPRAAAEGLESVGEGGRCPNWVWVAALRNSGWTGAVADLPGRMAGMVHELKNPLTGTPLLSYHGSPAALAAHAHALPPGTQLYISARTQNGVLHALLGVVQPDGTLHVMHGPSGKTRIATPLEGAEIGPYTRRGPTGTAEIGTRVYDIKAGDLGAYAEHKWFVLDVPEAPPRQPRISEHVSTRGSLLAEGEALAPRARRNLEIELEAAGHGRDALKLYDDNQLLAAHGALQVELAPKRVAAFRGTLDVPARAELDALIDAPHLSSAPVAGPMEARLGKALATPVEVDPRLGFGEVRVVPDVGAFGILRGVKLVVGPGATVSSVIAHIPALHQYKQMVGVLGAARRTVDAIRRVLRGGGSLPVDSVAHESWREIQKLPPMIEARIKRIAVGDLDVVRRVQLEMEIEALEGQLARHAGNLGELRPGRGYIAMEGGEPFRVAANEPGSTRSGHWQDTMGLSVDPHSPRQAHVPVIEQGVAEAERLNPGMRDRVARIREPVHAAQNALDELLAEQQRLAAESWKFNEQARAKLDPAERARSLADEAAFKTIDKRIKDAEGAVARVREEGLRRLTAEMQLLNDSMAAEHTQAQRLAARDLASAFPLDPSMKAQLEAVVKAHPGLDPEEMLRSALRRYQLLTLRGPLPADFRLIFDAAALSYYSNLEKVININKFKLGEVPAIPAEMRANVLEAVFHELSHHWEYQYPHLASVSLDWRAARSLRATGGLETVLLPVRGKLEPHYLGNFAESYAGRAYSKGPATEVFTVGMEHMYSPAKMAKLYAADPEHFYLIFGARLP
ncbi:MAG TPA: hypothetical protein VLM79_04555, partial [Kofleriaceae bacterium]|nr:hypothetical protein [Kofleriaceae bacterium]